MPFDLFVHAVPDSGRDGPPAPARADLVALALARLPLALRPAVARIELGELQRFVNMGVHFDRVAWRAVFGAPGLPTQRGEIVLHDGQVVD